MRKLTFLLFLALTAPIGLQANNINDMDAAQTSPGSASQRPLSSSAAELAPYLAGAVPEVNGQVVFQQSYTAPGKTRGELFAALQKYLSQVITRPNALPASRITAAESEDGTLAVTLHVPCGSSAQLGFRTLPR